ncbi:MAG TPA: peptidoglycan DD-metalloendopeptidase family protein [Alphaproteobacteria bacterium]|nr:peptidoglycan DD-metalloendopeptidase family protein [Alphaproteobacteria bacterium]
MLTSSMRLAAALTFSATILAGCGFLGVPGQKGTATPAAATEQPQAPSETVTVQAGDTLYAIARRNNTPIRAIIDANGLTPPYALRPGQQLTVPHPQVHVVQAGETLYSVARQHGVDASTLVRVNDLKPPYKIIVGQRLILPGQVTTAAPSVASAPAGEVQHVELLPPPGANAAQPLATQPAAPQGTTPPAATTSTSPSGPPPSQTGSPSEIAIAPLPPPQSSAPSTSTSPSQSTTSPAQPSSSANAPVALPTAPPDRTAQTNADSADAVDDDSDSTPGKVASLPSGSGAGHGRFLWPVKGKIISGYGPKEGGLFNDGINIGATEGEDVIAADSGVVVYAGNEIRGFGNLVLVKHPDGWMTAYAHNDRLLVKRGQEVKRGQVIAKAGSTGSVSTPQLHFELRRGSHAVDPTRYMASIPS